MIPESLTWELSVLRDLRAAYQGRGMQFHINPDTELVPAFLGDSRPDAIAVGPDGTGVVFEIKSYRKPAAPDRAEELQRLVSSQQGWRLEVIYTNPVIDELSTVGRPAPEQIDSRLDEIDRLFSAGFYGPAFLSAWAVLEALARLALPHDAYIRADGWQSLQVVQKLAELGFLENEDADELRTLARLRSAVGRGDLSADVSAGQVKGLIDRLKTLRSEIDQLASSHETA